MTNNDLVAEMRNRARQYMQHSGCSQSVLLALQEGLGIGDEASFKAATTLSGGVARQGETCGALLGALMAFGLIFGRDRIQDTERSNLAISVAGEICNEFRHKVQKGFGFEKALETTLCKEMQERIYGRSFDLRNPAEREAFKAAGGNSENGCRRVCDIAVETVAERLMQQR